MYRGYHSAINLGYDSALVSPIFGWNPYHAPSTLLKAWYAPNQATCSLGGTPSVEDGKWDLCLDRSGNNFHWRQANTNKQLLLVNVNGIYAAQLDGIDDGATPDGPGPVLNAGAVISMRCRGLVAAASTRIVQSCTANALISLRRTSAFVVYVEGSLTDIPLVNDDNWHIVTLWRPNGTANWFVRVDGENFTLSGNIASAWGNGLALGTGGTNPETESAQISELVIYGDGATLTDVQQLEAYLMLPMITFVSSDSMFLATPPTPNRNDLTLCAGSQFKVTVPIKVVSFGRCYQGANSHNHSIILWDTTPTKLAEGIVIAASPSDSLGFKWVNLTTPIVLLPNIEYRLVSYEAGGLDLWQNNYTPNEQSIFNLLGACYVIGNQNTYPVNADNVAGTRYGSAALHYIPFVFVSTTFAPDPAYSSEGCFINAQWSGGTPPYEIMVSDLVNGALYDAPNIIDTSLVDFFINCENYPEGPNTITLAIVDNDGTAITHDFIITVVEDRPSINADTVVGDNLLAQFVIHTITPGANGGSTFTVDLDWGDSVFETDTNVPASGKTFNHTYLEAGSYVFVANIRDNISNKTRQFSTGIDIA